MAVDYFPFGKLQFVGDRVVAAGPALFHRPAVEVHTDRLGRAVRRLDARAIVGKVLDEENTYWIFSDITYNSFTWKNVMVFDDGSYTLDCEIHGKRVK